MQLRYELTDELRDRTLELCCVLTMKYEERATARASVVPSPSVAESEVDMSAGGGAGSDGGGSGAMTTALEALIEALETDEWKEKVRRFGSRGLVDIIASMARQGARDTDPDFCLIEMCVVHRPCLPLLLRVYMLATNFSCLR